MLCTFSTRKGFGQELAAFPYSFPTNKRVLGSTVSSPISWDSSLVKSRQCREIFQQLFREKVMGTQNIFFAPKFSQNGDYTRTICIFGWIFFHRIFRQLPDSPKFTSRRRHINSSPSGLSLSATTPFVLQSWWRFWTLQMNLFCCARTVSV